MQIEEITTKFEGIKYNIEIKEDETLASNKNGWIKMPPSVDLGTYWIARSIKSDFPTIILSVLCSNKDVVIDKEWKSKFKKELYNAFKQALYYELIREGEPNVTKNDNELTLDFYLNDKGDNLLGFRYEWIGDKVAFKFKDFSNEITKDNLKKRRIGF